MLNKRRIGTRISEEAAEQARVAGGSGGAITAIVSAAALIFSGISLYESVLKRPNLKIYVPPVVHYAHDKQQEVIVVPITVANTGARDGAILSMKLNGTNAEGIGKEFYSAYFVDRDFFASGEGFNPQTRQWKKNPRAKLPFAPISVSGRSNYSGTVLFYTKGKAFPKLIAEKGEFSFNLEIVTELDNSFGWLDDFVAHKPETKTFTVRLPYFSRQSLSAGTIFPMKSVSWLASAKGVEVRVDPKRGATPNNRDAPPNQRQAPQDAKPESDSSNQ